MTELPADLLAKVQERDIRLRGHGRALLLGDSMLGRFQSYGTGRDLLDPQVFENVAVGGTRSEHWIWLLENCPNQIFESVEQLKSYSHFFVTIGTNDLALLTRKPADISGAIINVLRLLRRACQAKIYYMGIFSRTDIAGVRPNVERDRAVINSVVKQFCEMTPGLDYNDGCSIETLQLFDDDGLHLNRRGYELLSEELQYCYHNG